jgi:hypothetical protein
MSVGMIEAMGNPQEQEVAVARFRQAVANLLTCLVFEESWTRLKDLAAWLGRLGQPNFDLPAAAAALKELAEAWERETEPPMLAGAARTLRDACDEILRSFPSAL